MKLRYACLFSLSVLFPVFTNCSEEDNGGFSLTGTNVSVSEIAGTWTATKALFSLAETGPIVEVDVVDEGGSVTLQIQSDGKFSINVTEQGEPAEISTGRLGFDEDLLVISFDDDPDEWEYFSITHNEPNLAIEGGTVYEAFDFDDDGIDDDAYIDFEFVRS